MERVERIIALLIYTLIFLLFLPVPRVFPNESEANESVLCNRIRDLTNLSDSAIMDLIRGDEDEGSEFYLRRRMEAALDAAEVLLLAIALPVSSLEKVQGCMNLHDSSINLFDAPATLIVIEKFLFKAAEIGARLEILFGPPRMPPANAPTKKRIPPAPRQMFSYGGATLFSTRINDIIES